MAASLMLACGGGGSGGGTTTVTTYSIQFAGTVSGLTAGQSIAIVGTLPTTGQSTTINISDNGSFSSSILLPSGYTLTNAGTGDAVISKQPTTGQCTLSFLTSAKITVICSSKPSAGGLYTGTMDKGAVGIDSVLMLVLRDDSNWMWLGAYDSVTKATTYYGVAHTPTGTSTSTTYTSNDGREIFSTSPTSNVAINATYVADASLNGTITIDGKNMPLALSRYSTSSYQYTTPPSLPTIVGTYSMSMLELGKQDTAEFAIDAAGKFSGTTTRGCNYNGTVIPLTSGENAYSLSVAFGASPCTFANSQEAGVAYLSVTTAGTQFIGATADANNRSGVSYIGTRK